MLYKVNAGVILPWAQFLACFGNVLVDWLFLDFGLLDLDLSQLNAGIIMIEFVVFRAIVILVGHAPRSVHDIVGLYSCVPTVDHLRVLRGLRLEHSLLLSGIVDLLGPLGFGLLGFLKTWVLGHLGFLGFWGFSSSWVLGVLGL